MLTPLPYTKKVMEIPVKKLVQKSGQKLSQKEDERGSGKGSGKEKKPSEKLLPSSPQPLFTNAEIIYNPTLVFNLLLEK